MSDDKTLDDVIYQWACECVIPWGGKPENELQIRQVHNMLANGFKLLNLAQVPAIELAQMRDRLARLEAQYGDLVDAAADILDALDANTDERAGVSSDEWDRRIIVLRTVMATDVQQDQP